MQSGCPHSQGGTYPAFQHQSNVATLTANLDNNGRPKTLAHPAYGKQNIMVAIPHSKERRVAYNPAQWQRGSTQAPQNFLGLHHQHVLLANIENSGFHPPVSRDSTFSFQNRHCEKTKTVNDDFHLSANVPAQHSNYFGTSAHENSVRQSIHNNGQQKESPRHFMEGSKVKKTSGVQQSSTSSAGLQGVGVGVVTKAYNLPILEALLKKNSFDVESSFTTPCSSSKKTNSNIKPDTSAHLSGERHHKNQHSGSSPPALHCGQTRTQIPKQSEGTHQRVCSPSPSGQPSIGKVLPDVEMEPIGHDHILDFIDKRMEYYRTHPHKDGGGCTNDKDLIHQYDSTLPLTVSDFEDMKKQSHKCRVLEQSTAVVGQERQEDSSKGRKAWVELSSKSKEMGDCTTSASENQSTGTLPSVIENLKHASESAVGWDLPVKKHLDVVTAYGDGKLVYSEDCCEDTLIRSNDETFHSKWWCSQSLQNVTTLHYTLTALKELIASLEKVETNAEMNNFSKSILQQYWNGDIDNIHLFTSTEYRQIMKTVAATCTKSEDESPVVLTSVSEWHPGLMANCSLSQKESVWLNKNLEAIDQEPGISGASKDITAKERGITGPKPVKAAALDSVQVVTDIPEDLPPESGSVVSENKTFELTSPIENHYANTNKQKNIEDQQHCHVIYEEVRALSKVNDKIPNVVSFPTYRREQICEGAREKAGSMSSQMGLSNTLSGNKVKEDTPLSKSGGEVISFKILKDPQYEDISDDDDDDVSQLSTELPQTEHEELRFPTCFEDPHYEEISEEEDSQIENPSLEQVPTPDNRHSHLARQTTHSVPYRPSSVLKYEDQTEDQMDDDWIVIPISMLDLKFELEDEDQGGPEDVLDDGENGDNKRQSGMSPTHHAVPCLSPKPVPASAFSQLEIFDTIESFKQAVHFKKRFEAVPGSSTPEHEMDSEEDPHTPQKTRESYSEPEDSCETEDSCDYSSASEHNYLTVHRRLLKCSASLPPERCYPVSDIESDSDEVTNAQNSQTSSSDKLDHMQKPMTKPKADFKHVQPKTNKQRFSEKEDVIIIDSDTEDELDLNCNKTAKRKKILFSGSVYSGDTQRGQQKRHSPDTEDSPCGTVKEQVQRNRPSSADSPAPQHQSQFKDLVEDACPEQSHGTKSGQLIATNAASEHVQHNNNNRQMISEKRGVMISLASDTEDKSGHNYKKAKRKRLYLPASADSVQQKRQQLETVDTRRGTAGEKLQELRLSPADLSVPQRQTKANDTRVGHVMEDPCSDSSHSVRNSGHLIDHKPAFEHIQHKTVRQKIFKKKRTVFHGFEEEDKSEHISKKKDLFALDRLSCEDSPEHQLLSVDLAVDSSLIPNPEILCLVQKSHPSVRLERIKESRVHKEDKDETRVPKTPTATRKKSVSCDTSTSDSGRNKGQFMSKPKLGNERRHETKDRGQQADVMKHKLVTRQFSFPSQEGPSTSTSSLSSTRGQLSEGRSSSASSRVLPQSGAISAPSAPRKSKSPPIPRHLCSSKLRQSHSYDNPSTSDHPCARKGPSSSANTQLSARKQVIKDWHNSFFPTRRDRKRSLCMEEDLRSMNNDFQREARPGPSHYDRAPRQRHKSHDPPTALMKKSMCEAKEWSNHIHRETPKEPRSVGEGYKWSEKPLATQTKGSARKQTCRSSQRPHQ